MGAELSQLKIVVDETTFGQTEAGNISSIIFFDFGTVQFPENGWYDKPVAVVTDWLFVIQELNAGKTASGELWFLDGDFWLDVQMRKDHRCDIRCESEGPFPALNFSTDVPFEMLFNEMVMSVTSILRTCQMLGFSNDDTEQLGKLIKRVVN